MITRGLDLGKLDDDEYIHACNVDELLVEPLYKASLQIDDAKFYSAHTDLDNKAQKEYVKTQVESLISGLKDILVNIEGE